MVMNMLDPRMESHIQTIMTEHSSDWLRYTQHLGPAARLEFTDAEDDPDSVKVWRVERNTTQGVEKQIWHETKVRKDLNMLVHEMRRFSWFVQPPPDVAPDIDRPAGAETVESADESQSQIDPAETGPPLDGSESAAKPTGKKKTDPKA